MVDIFYCTFTKRMDVQSFENLLRELPVNFEDQILKFRRWEDRQRALLAKILLQRSLKFLDINHYAIGQLKFTKYKRPYFDDRIDFNISHSGKYILCGISVDQKVGLDIEEIKSIQLKDFNTQFSEKELKSIGSSADKMYAFYNLWTQKESFLKAIGTGLQVSLKEIKISDHTIIWNNKHWYLHKINFEEKYISHLCCDLEFPEIIMHEITIS